MEMKRCNARNGGSNSRKSYPQYVGDRKQNTRAVGIFTLVRESIDKVWRKGGRNSEPSMTRYSTARIQSPNSSRDYDSGWLNYFTHRTLRASTRTSETNGKSTRGTSRPRKIRRTHFCGKEQLPVKDSKPPVRFLGIRRSISLPGEEMEKSRLNLRRSLSSKEVTNQSRRERKVLDGNFRTREERIVEQTKDFCRDAVLQKLKQSNLFNRVKLTRPPSCDQWVMRDVLVICNALERRNPSLCRNLSKQIGITLRSEEILRKVFFELALEIITTRISGSENRSRCQSEPQRSESEENGDEKSLEITWGRIMAILVAAGALAVDCINQGHSELVGELIEICGEFFLEEGVVDWIRAQGGWETLCDINSTKIRDTDATSVWNIILISVCALASVALWVGISNLTVGSV